MSDQDRIRAEEGRIALRDDGDCKYLPPGKRLSAAPTAEDYLSAEVQLFSLRFRTS